MKYTFHERTDHSATRVVVLSSSNFQGQEAIFIGTFVKSYKGSAPFTFGAILFPFFPENEDNKLQYLQK